MSAIKQWFNSLRGNTKPAQQQQQLQYVQPSTGNLSNPVIGIVPGETYLPSERVITRKGVSR